MITRFHFRVGRERIGDDEGIGIEKINTSFIEGSLIRRWREIRSEI